MDRKNSFTITSTPLDDFYRSYGIENDSGYHSNNSCSSVVFSSGIRRRARRGQCLLGQERIDFFHHLGSISDYSLIVRNILSHLDDIDLYNASCVSRLWKHIILSIPSERKRLRNVEKEMRITKENRVTIYNTNSDCDTDRGYESPRNTLGQIQNLKKEFSLSNSPSSSASSFPLIYCTNRFEAYQKEGLKLTFSKRLFPCPKCKLPSHVDEQILNTAECTNTECRYRFCFLCDCEEHVPKMCKLISTPVARKPSGYMGTMNSKKNLKRLLL